MASEAQRLIGISLSKIAQSRQHRGGVSLHKNLLVATVLQKARYIFMEEAYNMVHFQPPAPIQAKPVEDDETGGGGGGGVDDDDDALVGLTAEEAGINSEGGDYGQCVKCAENQDKENHPPYQVTYLDLDKTSNVLRERSNSLKRRRAIAEWETEEAVQSILPKRTKNDEPSNADDNVFLDDATLLSDAVNKEYQDGKDVTANNNNTTGSTMEIDRITSLVSIFSFGINGTSGVNNNNTSDCKLNRSMSAPDLCSAQAKDPQESIQQQQRQFIAMTV